MIDCYTSFSKGKFKLTKSKLSHYLNTNNMSPNILDIFNTSIKSGLVEIDIESNPDIFYTILHYPRTFEFSGYLRFPDSDSLRDYFFDEFQNCLGSLFLSEANLQRINADEGINVLEYTTINIQRVDLELETKICTHTGIKHTKFYSLSKII